MELHQKITKLTGEYLNSEKFDQALQKQVEDTIHDAVKSMFSFGELRDVIREGLKEKVAIDLKAIDFTHVNQVVTDLVKKKCYAAFQAPLLEKLSKELDDMFHPAPAEITMQSFIDLWKEDLGDECGCDGVENILVEISRTSYNDKKDGSGTVKIWNGGKKTERSYSSSERNIEPDLHMYVIGGKIRLLHGITDKDAGNSLATNVYNKEAKIFMMYCAGTVIKDFEEADDGSDLDTSIGRH